MTALELKPTFYFDRYINGVKMAEDVCVERASSLSAAMVVASKIASRGPNGEAAVLVYRPTPLAEALAVPEVAALVEALRVIASAKDLEAPSEYNRGWNTSRSRLRDVARAALRAIGEGRA